MSGYLSLSTSIWVFLGLNIEQELRELNPTQEGSELGKELQPGAALEGSVEYNNWGMEAGRAVLIHRRKIREISGANSQLCHQGS